ncbi:hypothetical protein N0V87_000951 [Didymella glomerata]|uniref:NADH dehydrogenase [ubiquinone] 1 beta subcomplex subunit 11, mitochondrial n=1 Tax=Didymella glomerata TaxID=749621 RepID=A0A9W8X7M4_9PLEO|nr:hypothetical protein N0V87_000951 [Didymella glomerata]
MSAPRAFRALARPALTLRAPVARTSTPFAARAFSQSVRNQGGDSHHYDAPSGWLFGVKPGEEYKKEGWENATFYVFIPMMVLIQTWALEEARRRLEAEGILADPDVKKD